jgi:hypothetical protein
MATMTLDYVIRMPWSKGRKGESDWTLERILAMLNAFDQQGVRYTSGQENLDDWLYDLDMLTAPFVGNGQ